MRVWAAVVIAATVLLGGAAPATTAFEFRGHKIGEDLASTFPNYRDPPAYGKASCSGRGSDYACGDPTATAPNGEVSIGGVRVMSLYYLFHEGRLYSVSVMFHDWAYPRLKELLVARYGQPTTTTTETVGNAMGAKFQAEELAWQFAEGRLVLKQRSGSIDVGKLSFENPVVDAEIEAARLEAVRKKAADAL